MYKIKNRININLILIFFIELYQKYISPYKGYTCSHRLVYGGDSCSECIKKIFYTQDLATAIKLSRNRFRDCTKAGEILVKTRNLPYQAVSNKNKLFRILLISSLFILPPLLVLISDCSAVASQQNNSNNNPIIKLFLTGLNLLTYPSHAACNTAGPTTILGAIVCLIATIFSGAIAIVYVTLPCTIPFWFCRFIPSSCSDSCKSERPSRNSPRTPPRGWVADKQYEE